MSETTESLQPVVVREQSQGYTRREIISLAGLGVLAVVSSSINVPHAAYLFEGEERLLLPQLRNLEWENKTGDHVISLRRIREYMGKRDGRNGVGVFELNLETADYAIKNFNPFDSTDTPQKPETAEEVIRKIFNGVSGVGTSREKAHEHYQAIQEFAANNILVIVDTPWTADTLDMIEEYVRTNTVLTTASAIVLSGALINAADITVKKKQGTTRRAFLRTLAGALGGLAVTASVGSSVADSTIESHVSNDQLMNLKIEFLDKIRALFGDRRTNLIGKTLTNQRSMNMLRGAEIALRILDRNPESYKTPDEQAVQVYSQIGIGHSDISVYSRQTQEDQDIQIRERAQQVLSYFLDDFPDTLEKEALHDYLTTATVGIVSLGIMGFGISGLRGITDSMYQNHQLPESLPKTSALLYIEELRGAAEEQTDPKRKFLLQLSLQTFSEMLVSKYYVSQQGVDNLRLYPFTREARSLTGCQIIPFSTGSDGILQQMKHLYNRDIEQFGDKDVFKMPYGYVDYYGLPVIIYAKITKQNGMPRIEPYYRGLGINGESQEHYTRNPLVWDTIDAFG